MTFRPSMKLPFLLFTTFLICLSASSLGYAQSGSKGSGSKGSGAQGSGTVGSSTNSASQGSGTSGTVANNTPRMQGSAKQPAGDLATALLAGGCFWCVESDFEKCPGVVDIVSGYTGGRSKVPTYENYASSGHREAVLVTYDPTQITFMGICEWLVKHIDPTDSRGQFVDRGIQYAPAIYVSTAEEREAAKEVITTLKRARLYGSKTVNLSIFERKEFYPAEAYHQDYHTTHPQEYMKYRQGTGRDAFVTRVWGANSQRLQLPGSLPSESKAVEEDPEGRPWVAFKKPSAKDLRRQLTATQFEVTQEDGTEPPFRNAYWDNKREGLYVDVVSGAPLFSSRDKFKSGTGWPSFVKPVEEGAVTLATDYKMGYPRTEVRSRYGDSHLGHVFNDGPRDRGGQRYCMNSAAMRFIPVEKLEEEGYGAYLELFK